jgi:hypothetical protein
LEKFEANRKKHIFADKGNKYFEDRSGSFPLLFSKKFNQDPFIT